MADQTPTNHQIKSNFPLLDIFQLRKMISAMRFENRFTLDSKSKKLVGALLRFAKSHKEVTFNTHEEFFRARLHEAHQQDMFPQTEMGAPPQHKAGHGRLNPQGIPYLYLASNPLTAVSECRPHARADLTVATFKTCKEIRLVNLSSKHRLNPATEDELQTAEVLWTQIISLMFSAPFDPRDDTLYVPTQYLAERIKGVGWDGIMYDSALSPTGYNVALFDVSLANPERIFRSSVQSVSVEATFEDSKC